MKAIEQIITFLEAGAVWAEALLPDGTPPDVIARAAGALLRIAKAAVITHEKITGQPLDLNKLRELPRV